MPLIEDENTDNRGTEYELLVLWYLIQALFKSDGLDEVIDESINQL